MRGNRAGLVICAAAFAVSAAACSRRECPDPILIRVGDTAWAFPQSAFPTVERGTYVMGRRGWKCPLPGRSEIVSSEVIFSPYTPGDGPTVSMNSSPDADATVARMGSPWSGTAVADRDAARAGWRRQDHQGMMIFTPIHPGPRRLTKISCGFREGRLTWCFASGLLTGKAYVEASFSPETWPAERWSELDRRVAAALDAVSAN